MANLTVLGTRVGKKRAGAVLVSKELPTRFLLSLRIVVLNEAASAAHEVEPHQVPPVVCVFAKVEGSLDVRGDRLGVCVGLNSYIASKGR